MPQQQQKKQPTTYVPVTFMVPANLLGSMKASDVTCQVGQARFKAVQVSQQRQQQQKRQTSPSAQKKQSTQPLRPHLFGGRTPSQLLAVAISSAKRHQRPVFDTTTDDGKLTPSQLALNLIPKQYQTTFTTTERGRLTPSQLHVAQKRQAKTLRPSLFAGPTGSQLFVKTERLRLKARNQRALESLVYLTGVAELLAPTVYNSRSSSRSTTRKSQQQQQQQQRTNAVPSLPAKLEPTPSLLLLKYLSQVPPAAVSGKKPSQQQQRQQQASPAEKWAQKKAVSRENLFLEPFLAAFKL